MVINYDINNKKWVDGLNENLYIDILTLKQKKV